MAQLNNILLWSAGLGVALAFASCSSGPEKPPTQKFSVDTGGAAGARGTSRSNSNGSTSSNSGGTGGSGGSDGGGDFNQPGAPIVTMLTPDPEETPDEVYNEELESSCRIEPSDVEDSSEPDPSSVVFELIDEDNMVLDTADGAAADQDGVFEATFAIQNMASGPVTVRCTASDTSDEPLKGRDSATTFIDHGPIITIVTPEEGGAEAASSPVAFEYEILPDELVNGDEGAEVGDVTLSVRGVDFELEELSDRPGVYRTTVDFTDANLFAEVPTGALLVAVNASNSRDKPVIAAERYEFLLDGSGPRISLDDPVDGDVIGGTENLKMTITDSVSDVDWDTLVVTLNDQDFAWDPDGPWTREGDVVTFQFETAQVTGSVIQINVNIRVSDVAGNESIGESALYHRDEKAPFITLDAPPFRAWRIQADETECSHAFDPLGNSPGHGSRVPNVRIYRALVYDQTNFIAGQEVLHMAGLNKNSVQIFILRPDDGPLVLDSDDEDDVCDEIALTYENQDGDEVDTPFQDLGEVPPQGNPWWGDGNNDGSLPDTYGVCTYAANPVAEQPAGRCLDNASDMHVVLSHDLDRNESLVYGINPRADSFLCTGAEWELAAPLPGYQGWVCLAARARDRVGNQGISRPIAVCVENSSVAGEPSCWTDLDEEPPECTDGCTLPPDFPAEGVFFEW